MSGDFYEVLRWFRGLSLEFCEEYRIPLTPHIDELRPIYYQYIFEQESLNEQL